MHSLLSRLRFCRAADQVHRGRVVITLGLAVELGVRKREMLGAACQQRVEQQRRLEGVTRDNLAEVVLTVERVHLHPHPVDKGSHALKLMGLDKDALPLGDAPGDTP